MLACATAEDGLWKVSLNVQTTQDVAGLLAAVREPLLGAGFTEKPDSPAVGVDTQTAFVRHEGEVLTVAVIHDGTTSTMTIGGAVAQDDHGDS